MGLFENDDITSANRQPAAQEKIELKRRKIVNLIVILATLAIAAIVGFAQEVRFDLLENRSLEVILVRRLTQTIGTALGFLIIAGIPSIIAARYYLNWRILWIGISTLLLLSKIIMIFYRSS